MNLAHELGLGYPIREDAALCPMNLAFIQKQLQDTLISLPSTGYRPKRLLDLGANHFWVPRVIECSLNGSSDNILNYATLSYCWGPPHEASFQLKLTRETRSEFLDNVPLERLSPDQLDAVIVCRTLGIRYIWIDSLCILQGD